MNRTLLGLMLAWLALATASCCGKAHSAQSKTLDAHTSLTLKDAWIFGAPNKTSLLRAQFIVQGEDPNQPYNMKAALRADETGADIKSIYVWLIDFPPDASLGRTNRVVMWEFKDFPTNTPNIYLRQYYLDKIDGHVAKTLDFVLPGTGNLRMRDSTVD